MHRTFNMGTGFVASLPPAEADALVDADGEARVVGTVEEAEEGGVVEVRGLSLR
jgi:phosphoribosylformylglycinamidine cyclo-ligase